MWMLVGMKNEGGDVRNIFFFHFSLELELNLGGPEINSPYILIRQECFTPICILILIF